MAGFEFRLEPLLKLRKMRQEQVERELAQRLSVLLEHQRQVASLDDQIVDFYYQVRRSQTSGVIQVTGLLADRRYLNHLHRLRDVERAAVTSHQERVDQTRRKLAEAKKQTDMMEKLKEHQRSRFWKEVQRKETIELDDLTTAKTAWQYQLASSQEAWTHEDAV